MQTAAVGLVANNKSSIITCLLNSSRASSFSSSFLSWKRVSLRFWIDNANWYILILFQVLSLLFVLLIHPLGDIGHFLQLNNIGCNYSCLLRIENLLCPLQVSQYRSEHPSVSLLELLRGYGIDFFLLLVSLFLTILWNERNNLPSRFIWICLGTT